MEYVSTLWYLCPLLFLAGIIDGIAGGGGLVALPAYLLTGMPVHMAYGCNKLQSFLGTSASCVKYVRAGMVDLKFAYISSIFALGASFFATRIILFLSDKSIKLVIAILLPVVLVAIIIKVKMSLDNYIHNQKISLKNILKCAVIGVLMGFYDGFFGPGGGTIAVIFFSLFMNYDLCVSCGNGKVIIVISNLIALMSYISEGLINYYIAIPCAAVNIIGSLIGANLTLKYKNKLIVPTMSTIIIVLVAEVLIRKIAGI